MSSRPTWTAKEDISQKSEARQQLQDGGGGVRKGRDEEGGEEGRGRGGEEEMEKGYTGREEEEHPEVVIE